jgi:hypothetical protein
MKTYLSLFRKAFLAILLFSAVMQLSAQSVWEIDQLDQFPEVFDTLWFERGTGGDTPGVFDLFSVVSDESNPGNVLLKIEETGSVEMREKIAFNWNANSSLGKTVLLRTRGTGETARNLTNQGFYLELADGHIREIISGYVESDGSTSLKFESTGQRVAVDINEWHTYRFTMAANGQIELFIDETATPAISYNCTNTVTYNYLAIGDPSTSGTFKQYINYILMADGTQSPSDLAMPAEWSWSNDGDNISTSEWYERGTSGDTPGVFDLFSIVDDIDGSGNQLIKIEETGTIAMREKLASDWNADNAIGKTIILRSKGSGETARSLLNQGFYLELADGNVREIIKGVVEADGSTSIEFQSTTLKVSVDLNQWHTYRFTMEASGIVELYIDEDSIPVYSEFATESTTYNYFALGDPSTSGTFKQYIDFIKTADGVFSPAELPLPIIIDWDWRFEGNEVSDTVWYERGTSGDIPGVFDIFLIKTDDDNSANKHLKIQETGTTEMREKIAHDWNANHLKGKTIVLSSMGTGDEDRGQIDQGFYLELADGNVREIVIGEIESDGSTSLLFQSTNQTVNVNIFEWHTYRFTMAPTGRVELYIDEEETPSYSEICTSASTYNYFAIGDPSTSGTFEQYIDYIYYIDSIYSPIELPIEIEINNPSNPVDPTWVFLAGPEEENDGENNIQITSNLNGNVSLFVDGKRGHVARQFEPVELPAEISFKWRSTYDETVTEVATELWGTGDWRISLVGLPSGMTHQDISEANLGIFEGVQFRIFPHVDDCPIRRYTGDESHTSTSIWVRYTDPDRLTGDDGEPHTGLQSDACQNRNREDGTHNCGWDRHDILEDGFDIDNNEEVEMKIYISDSEAYIQGNGRKFSIEPSAIRFDKLSAIEVGITNTSRGFETLEISDLSAVSFKSAYINSESPNDMPYSGIQLCPNPANDFINITNLKDVKSIYVLDIMGRVKLSLKDNIPDETISVDVAGLEPGIYLLRVATDRNNEVVRFVKN